MSEVDKHSDKNISRILVGNKKDLEDQREIQYSEAKDLADHFNIRFLETSAKSSFNVEDAFTLMTREIKSKVQPKDGTKPNQQRDRVKLGGGGRQVPDKKKSGGCC